MPNIKNITALLTLPQWKKEIAQKQLHKLRPLIDALDDGISDACAIELFVVVTGMSSATGRRFVARWHAEGYLALVPKIRGRVRKDYGWEQCARELFTLPARPKMTTVAYWLREKGFGSATDSRVRRYLKSLPKPRRPRPPRRKA